jgi:D-aminoacyl-tRNA deacylase
LRARTEFKAVRAVAQRVREATVRVDGEEIARMREGLLALVGVAIDDTATDAEDLARKLVGLRVFPDADGRMNRSLLETGGTLGVVSQFTLLGDVRQGRRPSYGRAAPADRAAPLLEAVLDAARRHGVPVVSGRFQAMMDVSLVNAGPVTILLDTRREF